MNGFFLAMVVATGLFFFVGIFFTLRLVSDRFLLRPRLKMLVDYQPMGKLGDISTFGSYRNKTMRRRFLAPQKKKNSFLKKVVSFVQEHFLIEEDKLKLSFRQAGWSSHDVTFLFVWGKVALMFLGFIGVAILAVLSPFFQNLSFLLQSIFALTCPLVGWILLDIYLNFAINRRFKRIEENFPQALDLLVICVGAGLPFNRSIERVARELSSFNKDVARELALTRVELELILDTKQALTNLSNRVPIPMIKTFTTTLLQSFQQGTPLLGAMDQLSEEIRDNASQLAEVHAAKLPSLLMVPLVLLILPSLFIILLGPALTHLVEIL